jgi:hypothetical protein
MKKIVLRDLAPDVVQLIEEEASMENLGHTEAVLEILSDAATERAVQHDIALIESWVSEGPEDDADLGAYPRHSCCSSRG